MPSALVEKMRRAREQRVEAGGFSFTIRRPTELEMWELRQSERSARGMSRFVIGWDGVREMDLVANGEPHPLPFDAEACAEWLADRPDLFAVLADRILEAYNRHSEEIAAAGKA